MCARRVTASAARSTAVAAVTVAILGTLLVPDRPIRAQVPSRVIAVADVHGAYDSFLRILREAGLVDGSGRWIGGTATLVQTGDVTDRGLKVREVLDLLMALEAQAPKSGGRVVALLGNHEAMNATRFVRDVAPLLYAEFTDGESESRRLDAYQQYVYLVNSRRQRLGGDPFTILTEEAWMAAHPPGFVEYLEAFGPEGRYGRWLRNRDAVARIDRTVYLHGGLNPESSPASIDEINTQVRAELRRFDAHSRQLFRRGVILPFFTFEETLEAAKVEFDWWIARVQAPAADPTALTDDDRTYLRDLVDLLQVGTWSIVHPDGPLWFRGFAQWADVAGGTSVGRLLEQYDADRFVVGHTPTSEGRIVPRFDDRVFLIDTGMLTQVYNGRASAFEIVEGDVTAVYEDGRQALGAAEAAGAVR